MAEGDRKRSIAQKVSIQMLAKGQYITQEGWNPNYLLTPDNRKVERMNVLGIITIPPLGQHNVQFSIDDGTGTILIQSFEHSPNLTIGTCVCVIGRPIRIKENICIVAEIIKPVDAKWMNVRKEELKRCEGSCETPQPQTPQAKEQPQTSLLSGERILNTIKQLDQGDGAEIEGVLEELEKNDIQNGEDHIHKLLRDGEIFESRKGKVKVIE